MSGTLTLTTPAGTVVSEGDVLYEVEGHPVVLLQGDLPAWQSMGLEEVTLAVKAIGHHHLAPRAGHHPASRATWWPRWTRSRSILLYGDLPAYRTPGVRLGRADVVQQLETALVALGYDPDGDGHRRRGLRLGHRN